MWFVLILQCYVQVLVFSTVSDEGILPLLLLLLPLLLLLLLLLLLPPLLPSIPVRKVKTHGGTRRDAGDSFSGCAVSRDEKSGEKEAICLHHALEKQPVRFCVRMKAFHPTTVQSRI